MVLNPRDQLRDVLEGPVDRSFTFGDELHIYPKLDAFIQIALLPWVSVVFLGRRGQVLAKGSPILIFNDATSIL